MSADNSSPSRGFRSQKSLAQLTTTRNVIRYFRLALTFGGVREEENERYDAVILERTEKIETLEGLSAHDIQAISNGVAEAAVRIERARDKDDRLASRTSALCVTLVLLIVAVLSVYALPHTPSYGLGGSIAVLLAALCATLVGAFYFLFSLPRLPRIPLRASFAERTRSCLDVLPDWILFVVVVWVYGSIAITALRTIRSPDRHHWIWEVLLVGAAVPLSALLGTVVAVVVAGVAGGRKDAQLRGYVLNDALIVMLMDLAYEAQRTIPVWYSPRRRRRLLQLLESAARRVEVLFLRAARSVHGASAAPQVRDQGRRIAAALRQHERSVALAAGPSQIARVRDALCSGFVAAAEGDWPSLSNVDPESAVRSLLGRLMPRVGPFLLFGGACGLLLWLSRDERWTTIALAGAIPLGLSAILSLLSPREDVTRRTQDVLDKAFSPLWRL